MKRNFYKLFSNAKQILFAFAFTVFSVTTYSQTTYTFNYTGGMQTLTVPAGNYSIQCWGAIGGWHANDLSGFRGKSGYSRGTLSLTATTTLYIATGGAGGIQTGSTVPGGWNGGGNGKYYSYAFNSGGGASHVATATGVLSALVSNTPAILIVAAGGAGGATGQTPGDGGGLNGGNSTRSGCTGGTQTTPGTSSIAGGNAIFGQGWDASLSGGSYGAGGGGWYGGGCESGGSSYLGGVTSATTIMFGQTGYVTNPVTSGDGLVLITELCSITLVASGSNSLNPAICTGQSLTLTTNAISNYSWSTGATTSSIVVAPTSNTVYGLTATSPSNCTSSKSISVTVSNTQPTLTINTSTNQTCLGKTVTLTATGAINYTWSNSVVNGVAFTPSLTNTYTVTGQNGCGTASALTTVSVSPLPVSIVSTHTAICTNLTATISLTSGATSYTLQPGTVVSTASNFIVSPQSNTTYSIAASDGTCAGTATITVNALAIPSLTTSVNNGTVCAGFPAVMSVMGAQTYSWTTLNQTSPTVTVFPTAPAAYPVVGTNSLGCSNSTNQIVFTTASPVFSINTNQPNVCKGNSATLTAVGNAGSYAWTNGPPTSVNIVSPVINTTYTVIGTSTSNTCTTTKTIQIGVFTVPLTISGNSVVCSGQEVQLTGSGAQNYNWVGINNFATISVTPVAATVYTLVGTTTTLGLNCSETLFYQVNVNPNPTVTVVASPSVICSKTQVSTLTASGASSYTWSNSSLSPSTTFSSNSTGFYTYSVIGADANNCTNTVSIQLKVNACTGIESYQKGSNAIVVFPNPSQGEFTIKSQSTQELNVINELGQPVMQINLNESNQYELNVTGLSAGIYLLMSNQHDTVITQKIIVSK